MTAQSLVARLALLAIRGYQRYLSPIKGFSCAFRVATGGDSCSAYGYSVIRRQGLGAGLRLLRRRLNMCHLAHQHGRARGHGHGVLHRQRGFLDAGCDAPCDAGCAHDLSGVMDCLGTGCGGPGPGDCDWPWRRDRKLKTGDSKELEKLRARVEARKRKDS